MQNNNEKSGSAGKDQTISELAHEHLKNQAHTTSDEEIKNARLELDEPIPEDTSLTEIDNTTVFPPVPGEEEVLPEKQDDEDDKPNPYDVLAS